jgi:hypothetical protein
MIVFELICPRHHRFEGWFASTADFEGQKDRGLLLCPVCGHSHIEKLPTAKIGKHEAELLPAAREDHSTVPGQEQAAARLHEIINYVLMNTENVGRDFAAEARRIHQENVPYRSIRGTATRKETEELLEEGIPVMSLPIPPQGDWH